jgi:hypothetical protein
MREARKVAEARKATASRRFSHAVILVTQEGRLFAGQHRVGWIFLRLHIPLAGE